MDNELLLSDEEIKAVAGGAKPYCHSGITNFAICKAQLAKAKPLIAKQIFEEIEASGELLEIGRKAIEDILVEWRDRRLSEFNRGNGLVIRERDGRDSNIIRFGPETALKIGLRAIGQALKAKWLGDK